VVVVHSRPYVTWETPPADGAFVGIEWPDGAFDEGVTDANGRVALPRRAPLGTPIHVTAFKEGHGLRSRVGYPLGSEEIPMPLPELGMTVALSGMAVGMVDPQNSLDVAVVTGGRSTGVGPTWSAAGYPGIPLTLVAAEFAAANVPVSPRGNATTYLGWTTAESPPLSRPAEIAIDFAKPATPAVWSGTFAVPPGDGLLAKVGTGFVCPLAWVGRTFQCLGWPRYIDVTEDGAAFAFEVEHLDVAGGATGALFKVRANQVTSMVLAQGPPVDGPQPIELPEAVVVTSPVGDGPHLLHDPVAWKPDPSHAGMVFRLITQSNLWTIQSEVGATTLHVPRLPSAVDAVALLGPSPSASVEGCRLGVLDDGYAYCLTLATSRSFTLELP
jgi:hypothetical protein